MTGKSAKFSISFLEKEIDFFLARGYTTTTWSVRVKMWSKVERGENDDRQVHGKGGRERQVVCSRQAAGGAGGDLFCHHRHQRRPSVYTQAGWESLCARYDALPLSQKSGTTSFLFSNAVECSPDKQFRFLVSSNLYQYAGIDRDVVIVGRAGQAEIWDADTYAEFEQAMLTPENLLASLEAIGL